MSSLIQQPVLASGTLVSREDGAALEHVAEYLSTGLLALYYGHTEFNVLIYPTKCEEWRSIILGVDPTSSSEATLGWLIFTSPLLPPLTKLCGPQFVSGEPKCRQQPIKMGDEAVVSAPSLVMRRLFHFDYDKLLPARAGPLPEHNFFLAIPDSRGAIGRALSDWLRAKQEAGKLFGSG
jgi:chromo domain-containing protein 1